MTSSQSEITSEQVDRERESYQPTGKDHTKLFRRTGERLLQSVQPRGARATKVMACLQSKKGARPRSKKIARPRKVSTNMYTLLSSFYCLKDCRFPKKFPTKTPDYGRSARWNTKFTARSRQSRQDENQIHCPITKRQVGKVKTNFTARPRWKPNSSFDFDKGRQSEKSKFTAQPRRINLKHSSSDYKATDRQKVKNRFTVRSW